MTANMVTIRQINTPQVGTSLMSSFVGIALPEAGSRTSEPLVNIQTLATHLRVTPRTIRKHVRSGKIPSIAIDNGERTFHRFRIAEVESALRAGGAR